MAKKSAKKSVEVGLIRNTNKKHRTPPKKTTKSSKEDFSFDDEIVIGVTKVPEKKDNKRADGKASAPKTKKQMKALKKKKKNKKVDKKTTRRNRIIKGVLKWTILLILLVGSIIFFLTTPLFNITEIEIVNSAKISEDTYISLSKIEMYENIFKMSKREIIGNIKENPYVDTVVVKRVLLNKIQITVTERTVKYVIKYADSYVYINSQGYVLEVNEEKPNVPILSGISTSTGNIVIGQRLCSDDLEKLGTVLKIMDSATSNQIADLITEINISNKNNYTLTLKSEKKTVYLGDASELSTRMLRLKTILQKEKGKEGEVFIDGDVNQDNAYFREKSD